jgi:hypothetical protein
MWRFATSFCHGASLVAPPFPLSVCLHMTTQPIPRVIRAYALPVPQFDTFKHYQRTFQQSEDQSAFDDDRDARTITNSEAMSRLVRLIELLAHPASCADMEVTAFVTALHIGDLKVVKVAA